MIAVDTNVLVRFFVNGDEPVQAAKATRVFRENDVLVLPTVILEAEWVLRANFGVPRAQVLDALEALSGLPRVFFHDKQAVIQAIGFARRGLDFADALHLAAADDATEFVTFDRRFAKRAAKMDAIVVRAI